MFVCFRRDLILLMIQYLGFKMHLMNHHESVSMLHSWHISAPLITSFNIWCPVPVPDSPVLTTWPPVQLSPLHLLVPIVNTVLFYRRRTCSTDRRRTAADFRVSDEREHVNAAGWAQSTDQTSWEQSFSRAKHTLSVVLELGRRPQGILGRSTPPTHTHTLLISAFKWIRTVHWWTTVLSVIERGGH